LKSKNLLTYAELFFGMALYGSTLPVSKIVTENFPVFSASALRTIIAVVSLIPFAAKYRNDFKKIQKPDYLYIFLIALSGVFLFSIFMLYGMKYASGVTGSIVMSATPAVTALGAFLFFKDSFDWKKISAIILSVAGIIVINISGHQHETFTSEMLLGSFLIFLAVCAEASYTLFAKRIKSDVNALVLTFLTALISIVLFLIPSLFELKDLHFQNVSSEAWSALIWWGLAGMGIATILWFDGIKKASGSTAAGFMSVMSVSALVLSYVILSEKFMWIHLAGFMLVFTGVILVSISDSEEMKSANQ
jgi:drug/metabolite transporter (DMT)-like permease